MILADSSIWVDLLRGTGRGHEFAGLLREHAEIAATEPVLMELLAGARTDKQYAQVRSMVTSVDWIGIDPACDFEAAAQIYRSCRQAGITPRGLTDCIIAAIAMRTESRLMTCDRDFEAMAEIITLTVV